MSFAVAPDAYDRFMGRYSGRLAPQLAAFTTAFEGGIPGSARFESEAGKAAAP